MAASFRWLTSFALAGFAASFTLPAQGCIDQQNVGQRTNGLEITGNQSAVQTFTCAQAGLLRRIDVDIRQNTTGLITPLDVRILTVDGAGVLTNTVLDTVQLAVADVPTSFAFTAVRLNAAIPVAVGTVLAVELSVPTTTGRAYAWAGDAPGLYANGTTFIRRNTGPLSFDMGFATYVGGVAGATTYGTGLAGARGIPTLTASAAPRLGTTPELQLSGSTNATTPGAIVVGVARANLPTPFVGTLLVQPLVTLTLSIPGTGLAVPMRIPDDPSLCGATFTFQVVQQDAAAAAGLSFTAGLELLVGA